jgi:hypothetical protein
MFAPVAPVTRRLVPTWALAAVAVPLLALASVAVARLRAALARRFDLRRCQQFVEAAAAHHLRSPRWGSSFMCDGVCWRLHLHVSFVSLLYLQLCRVRVCGVLRVACVAVRTVLPAASVCDRRRVVVPVIAVA